MNLNYLATFIKEHKIQVIIGSLALLLFLVFSVMAFVHTQSVQEPEPVEGTAPEIEANRSDADTMLSDEQKAKRDSYDNDTKEFIAILSAQLWGVGGGSPYLTFTDTTYTENTDDGDSAIYAYVITALQKKTLQASNPETITYTAAMETVKGSFFIDLTQETNADGSVSYGLASTQFLSPNDAYIPVSPSDTFRVSGLNEEVLALIDGNESGLNDAVAKYCAQYLPTAKDLTWANYITVNWETSQVTLTFTEGDKIQEILAVIYDRNAKTFTVNSNH